MTKYALITGASLGIGSQMAIVLHKKGYQVIGIAPECWCWEMKPLVEQIGLIPIACDIGNVEQIRAAVERTKQITGNKLHILYNNAGINPPSGPALEADDATLRKLVDVNLLGHMCMTKYCGEMVINAKGTIVFTTSVGARLPLSWNSAYCATTAAIDQYALVLRGEMQPFDVKVHSVITGGVDTGIFDSMNNVNIRSPFYDTGDVRDSIWHSAFMCRNPRTTISAQAYAEQVAAKVCQTHDVGFNIYLGWGAYMMHLMRWYLPTWLSSFLVQWYFKQAAALRKLRKMHQKRQLEN
ncbi:NAD(P)-binding protein [Metschnikowia bicuspidata]|uniref:NAD(P)-binding protein n=1 Tax=Metschnikowia bicuspidata TaxID=27322 RepID=A0A4P9ZAN8_9ASCO|nr:NAD(P)-binding protein [Metschnikowia bicuspidata]